MKVVQGQVHRLDPVSSPALVSGSEENGHPNQVYTQKHLMCVEQEKEKKTKVG